MKPLSACPRGMVTALARHRELLMQMIRRDVTSRYRGSALGILWTFATPLLMLAVYTFVFGVVFQARFGHGQADASTPSFALTLFCGLIIHSLFAECLGRSPVIILQHVAYVKKVVFPLEILPVMVLGSALFHFMVSAVVLAAGLWLSQGTLPATAWLFPLTVFPLLPLLLGMNWFLAALGVYVRDVSQLSGLLAMILMYLSPIFYPVEALPEAFRPFIYMNPLTCIIEAARGVMIFGTYPSLSALGLYTLLSTLFAWLGYWWFTHTRKGFADIL